MLFALPAGRAFSFPEFQQPAPSLFLDRKGKSFIIKVVILSGRYCLPQNKEI